MTNAAREVFEKATKAFNAHDLKGFAELLADDVVFEAPGGLRGRGKDACAQFFGGWIAAFPDAHVDIQNVEIFDNVGFEEGIFTGTHKGIMHSQTGDIPPTGRPVRINYMQALRFKDGKHTRFNLMFDRVDMLEQLGLMPAAS
jgi:steroid delta-isomerase-like uncharacterized protein